MRSLAAIFLALGLNVAAGTPVLAQEGGNAPDEATEVNVSEALDTSEAFYCPPSLDEDGNALLSEDGNPVFQEVSRPVLDDAGEPLLDEAGEPLTENCTIDARFLCSELLDEEGNLVLDENGAPTYEEATRPVPNESGEPVLNETGEPIMEACIVPGSDTVAEDSLEAVEDAEASEQSALSPLFRLLEAGGPVIVILSILAILALGVGLVKLVQFIRLGVGRAGFVAGTMDDILEGRSDSALTGLEVRKNPVARVMAAALRGKSSPEMGDELVREETTRVAQAQLDGLERGLALLSLIATIAPLLGLLGTVLGMIEAFQQMETVGDRVEPAVLAGGIWEALLTTAAGLAVAIPAAVLFTWFQRAVDVEGQRMEDAATQVFTGPLYRGKTA